MSNQTEEKRSKDAPLIRVEDLSVDRRQLVLAACAVANAIHVGAGGCIKDTLMEAELRRALSLADGELVELPK